MILLTMILSNPGQAGLDPVARPCSGGEEGANIPALPYSPQNTRSILQLPEDVAGEMLLDLAMSRDGLTRASPGIPEPIVPAAVADKDATGLLDLSDKVKPFHAI